MIVVLLPNGHKYAYILLTHSSQHHVYDDCLTTAGKAKRIVCMCGAGLSVSAGIPDFRTPGTGLYSNLQKFDLPYPEAVFEINYFKRNPAPFFMLAKVEHPA
jgi:NAD-dependent SIR2 family protein deacetylase